MGHQYTADTQVYQKQIDRLNRDLRTQKAVIETQHNRITTLTRQCSGLINDLQFIAELIEGFYAGDLHLESIATIMYDRLADKLGAFRGSITVYQSYNMNDLLRNLGLPVTNDPESFSHLSRDDLQTIALEHEEYLLQEIIECRAFRKRNAQGEMEDAEQPFFSRATLLHDLLFKSTEIYNDISLLPERERIKALKAGTAAFLNFGINARNGNRLMYMHFAFRERTQFSELQINRRFRSLVSVLRLVIELAAKNKELERLSTTDPLTKAWNRRSLEKMLQIHVDYARRYEDFFTIAIVDIDDFKCINDQFGHVMGDEVLRVFVMFLKKHSRDTDMVFRFGGEEFIILYPHTSEDGAITHLVRVYQELQEYCFNDSSLCLKPVQDDDIRVTFCAGVLPVQMANLREGTALLKEVDRLLYHSKRYEADGMTKNAISWVSDGEVYVDRFRLGREIGVCKTHLYALP